MNKNIGDTPERATRFASPDISHLVDRSTELRNRTRAVFEDMRRTSLRLHEALKHSTNFLNEVTMKAQGKDGRGVSRTIGGDENKSEI